MDKDFKKIFDKLVKDKYIEEDTAKVLTVMEAYSDYLDKAVELGLSVGGLHQRFRKL